MSKSILLSSKRDRLNEVVDFIKNKYINKNYQVQVLTFEDNGTEGKLVQIKNTKDKGFGKNAKNLSGLGIAGNIKFLPDGNDLTYEVFGGKWLDKAAVNVVSWVVLWPLFVTSVIGAYKQRDLIKMLKEDVLSYFANN